MEKRARKPNTTENTSPFLNHWRLPNIAIPANVITE